MEQLSFFEKLGILWQNILAHPIFVCLLLLPAVIIFINKKITKKVIIAIYLIILVIVLFVGNSMIFKLFDNMIDGLFMTLYFPNFITLFIVEVLSAIIALITFIKRNINKVNKTINIIAFVLIQTLFCLVVTVINANDIDVYKENALYSSSDVLTLMQLLMGTFAFQIISIIVVFSIEKITAKLDGQTKSVNHELNENKIITPYVIKEPQIEKQKPLDKKLIEENQLKPLNLNEEIAKDTAKKLIEDQQKQIREYEEKKRLEKQEQINQERLKERENLKKIEEEQARRRELDKLRQENDKNIKPLDRGLITTTSMTPIDLAGETNFGNFKEESLSNNESSLSELTVKNQVNVPDQESVNTDNQELIINLVIIDFDKMVRMIKNLKRVYTL